jgi:hypothetical protein
MRARMLAYQVQHFSSGVIETRARWLEKQVKYGISVAAETFEDAMRNAPSWLTTHPVTIVDARSGIGKKVQAAMLEAQRRTRGRHHETRFGFLGRWVERLASEPSRSCLDFSPNPCRLRAPVSSRTAVRPASLGRGGIPVPSQLDLLIRRLRVRSPARSLP